MKEKNRKNNRKVRRENTNKEGKLGDTRKGTGKGRKGRETKL